MAEPTPSFGDLDTRPERLPDPACRWCGGSGEVVVQFKFGAQVQDCGCWASDDLDGFIAEQMENEPPFAGEYLIASMAAAIHRDSDHGKDGGALGEWLCNCRDKAVAAASALEPLTVIECDSCGHEEGSVGFWSVKS